MRSKNPSPTPNLIKLLSRSLFVLGLAASSALVVTAAEGASVRVGTNTPGLWFTVDGVNYNSEQTFEWEIGSQHTIETNPEQSINGNTSSRYRWLNWSNGGPLNQSITISEDSVYIASFKKQYLLRMEGWNIHYGRSVYPSTGYFDEGSTIYIGASCQSDSVFMHWYGDGYTGPDYEASFVMTGAFTQYALFIFSYPYRPTFNFDGDLKSDISVYRPSEGTWYVQQSAAGFRGTQFGVSTDNIVPADYDSDGKADVAVYRPSEGNWYILRSSDGSFSSIQFGTQGDIPVPGNYDGGHAQPAVFRPSNGTWYLANTANGTFNALQFGIDGDRPVVSDFDGDGRTDVCVFRPSEGTWYRISSFSNVVYSEQFGLGSDIPVPADYNGDHKSDLAVYRPSSGAWYIHHSGGGTYKAFVFGLPDDIPAPADFDGNEYAELAVFRPSTGIWYRLTSFGHDLPPIQFGTDGDVPIPAAFRY